MQVFALPPVAAQLVRAGKIALDHYFELAGHASSFGFQVQSFKLGE
jgi:hypothetical protein